jgi:predicted nucleic acid-binding protein
VALVCDTSVLLAGLDGADPAHERCAALIEAATETLVVPTLVLSELDYWCHERLTAAAWLSFLEDTIGGAYRIEHPTQGDLERALELQRTYSDLEVGVVDASVLAVVERLGEPKLATLDHRHFSVMRPRHLEALRLLPG